MATKVIKTKTDDITGAEGASTYFFGLGSASYEIDLVDDGAALRKALEPFIRNGRRAGSTSYGRRQPRPERSDYLAKVREWARANNVPVATRGRVSAEVIEQFEAAMRQPAAKAGKK